MYIFENKNYTEEDLEKIADVKGYTFDELLKKNPGIKKTDPDPDDEGKKNPSQEIMDVTVEEDDTASTSGDFLSVYQTLRQKRESIKRNKRGRIISKSEPPKKFKPEDFKDDSFIDPKFKLPTEGELYIKDTKRKKEIQGIIEESIDPEVATQFETELQQIEKRNPNIADAVAQISKDTGGTENIFKLFDFKAAAEENATEVLDLTLETQGAVVDILKEKNIPIERIAQGRISLEDKEDIITEAKAVVLNKKLDNQIQTFTKDFSEKYSNGLKELQYLNNQIDILSGGDKQMDPLDSPVRIENYNNTVKEYNNLYNSLKKSEKEFQNEIETMQAIYTKERGDLFVKNFKKLAEKEKETKDFLEARNKIFGEFFGEKVAAPVDNAINTLLNESKKILQKGTVAIPQFLIRGAANLADVITGEEEYSMFDAFADQLSVETDKGFSFLPQSDKFKLIDEEGNYNKTFGAAINSIAQMAPFSLYILFEARRGDFKNAKKLLSSGYSKSAKLAPKQINQLNIVQSAWKATVDDNIKSGQELGLSPIAAQAYGFNLALAEGLTSLIMPETAYYKGGVGAIELGLFNSLKNTTTKKSVANATKKYFANIPRELIEEETMALAGDVLRISSGLGTQNNEFTNLIAQKELIASTILLSGTLGLPGLSRNYNNTKQKIYNKIFNDSNALLNNMQSRMKTLPKDEQGNVLPEFQDEYNALREARIFTTDLVRAVNVSPENVSSQDLDLIIQKNKLIEEKKELDPAFHKSINDQIAEIDKQIQESKITTTKAETEKKIKAGIINYVDALDNVTYKQLTQDEVDSLIEELPENQKRKFKQGNANLDFGFTYKTADGEIVFVENLDVGKEEGVITTGAHEAIHAFLFKQLEANPGVASTLGISIYEELGKIDINNLDPTQTEFAQRLQGYREQVSEGQIPPEQALEEALTLFSEAALNGDIKYDTSFAGKIKDTYNSILKRLGRKQEFDSGRDVYNFIKNFNNSLLKGEVSEDIIKGVKEGFKGKLVDKGVALKESNILKENEAIVKKSKSLTPKVTRDAENRIVELQKLKEETTAIAKSLGKKYAPSAKEQRLQGELLNIIDPVISKVAEQRTKDLYDKIPAEQKENVSREYYTESLKNDIFTFTINEFIENKQDLEKFIVNRGYLRSNALAKNLGIESTEEFGGPGITLDVTETADIAIEPEVAETVVQEELPKIKVAKRIFTPEEQTKLKEKVSQELPNITEEQLTFKTLPNLTAEVIAEKLNMPVKKLTGAANFTQDEFGRVQQFIKDNIKTVKLALPQAAVLEGEAVSEELIGTATNVPNKLLKNPKLYTRLERTTKKAGLVPYQKNKNIQDVDILEAVGIVEDKLTKGPRDPEAQTAKGVLNILGRTAANQEVREQGAQTEKISKSKETDLRAGVGDRILFSLNKEDAAILKKYNVPDYPLNTIADAKKWVKDVRRLVKIFNTKEFKLLNLSRVSPNRKMVSEEVFEYLVGNKDKNIKGELEKLKDEGILPDRLTVGASRPGQRFGSTPAEFENNIEKIDEFNKKHKKVFDDTWLKIKLLIDKDKNLAGPILTLLSFSQNERTSFMSLGAPVIGFQDNAKQFSYEHAMQQAIAYRKLIEAILGKKNFNKEFKNVTDNYFVLALGKVNDKKVAKAGYKDKFEDSWKFWWQRYFNPKVAAINNGINPNDIIFVGTEGKNFITLGEQLGINPDGSTSEGQVLIRSSVRKASAKNNNKLPKSKRLPKGTDNQLVLDNMKLIDEEINQKRKEFFNSEQLSQDFNKIIENKTGIAKEKKYSDSRAQTIGANKGRFKFFIPPSAEDFVGLLYNTLSKGKLGEQQMAWYKENLLDPYARAMNEISSARVALFEDYKTLKEDLKIIPKNLRKKIPGDDFTVEQAVRAYIWNKQGMEVPGLDNADVRELISYVANNNELVVFADNLIDINKGNGYPEPDAGWEAGTITTDLINSINTTRRAEALQQWQENADIIFSKDNLNKLQAVYGTGYRKALENILTRMKTGRNRGFNNDSLTGRFTDWINNSVGAIMFFNMRSALLQTISSVNFINYSDNNIFKAAKAFGNQKQYWSDFKFLFNSDFLKERRGGLRFNVSESDIADMAKEGGARGVLSKILQAGFLPTQAADSFAIASGGATFYRNRLNKYKKEGGKVEEELVYNASPKSFDKLGERTGLIYLATNKREAKAYADMNRGNVKNIYIDKNKVASEKDLISTMKELGINTTEGSIYELIDPRFDNFYIGKDAMNKVTNALAEKGFKAARYEDGAQVVSGKVESIVVFDKSVISNKKGTIKSGMSKQQAEEKAFLDFREVAEEAQQSSRPDRISAQQAGSLGRIILAFANTPAQYARLTKKALSDAVNNRGSRIENISKAIYYVAVQNFIFTALQNALFALAFDDEEEEDKKKEQKYLRMANSMSDSFLRGLGFAGAAVSTGKNVILKLIDESDKAEYKQKYGKALGLEVLGISPPVQSKIKKLVRAGDQYKYAKKAFDKDGFKFNSELYLPPANVISALTNVPLDRVVRKTDNLVNMTQADLAAWERAALFFGWQDWELGINDNKVTTSKSSTSSRSKPRSKSRSKSRSKTR